MVLSKGFFEENENSIIVNINDIVGKTPNEVVKVLEEVLRQKLDEKQEKDSEGYRESKHLEFTLISNRLEEIISIKNKLGEKIYELGGCQQTTHEIAGAYKELEESFNKLIAVEARYLASLK